MNQSIKNSIRMLLFSSGAPNGVWAECLYAVCVARNHVSRPQQEKTPEELLTGLKPSVAHLRTNGCRTWIRVPEETRKALEPKAIRSILLRTVLFA